MLNKFDIQGRIVRDPELRFTQSDKAVCQFTVVWNEKYKNAENKLYMDCVAWGKLGETINKYYKKGSMIIVSGKLYCETWETKDGTKRSRIKMTVNEAHFCETRNQNGNNEDSDNHKQNYSQFEETEDNENELPW